MKCLSVIQWISNTQVGSYHCGYFKEIKLRSSTCPLSRKVIIKAPYCRPHWKTVCLGKYQLLIKRMYNFDLVWGYHFTSFSVCPLSPSVPDPVLLTGWLFLLSLCLCVICDMKLISRDSQWNPAWPRRPLWVAAWSKWYSERLWLLKPPQQSGQADCDTNISGHFLEPLEAVPLHMCLTLNVLLRMSFCMLENILHTEC